MTFCPHLQAAEATLIQDDRASYFLHITDIRERRAVVACSDVHRSSVASVIKQEIMSLSQRIASAGAGRHGSELLDAAETGEQARKSLISAP